ncbi:MAG: type II toxin-antitoxin system RelE/ParE family toxin [Pirellulales bacterium]
MTFRVVLLPRAEADVEANALWWANHHSAAQAARWIAVIHEQLKSLAHFPERNQLSAENDAFPYEIRDKLLGIGSRPSYRAVITVQDDTVYILAVRRGAQDIVHIADIDAPPAV